MRDWSEDEEGPDPDYGVFGDRAEGCKPPPPPMPSKADLERARRARAQKDASNEVGRQFNRHMIDLFNQRMRP